MAAVATRNYGGLPRPHPAVNPFDSDDDQPVKSSTSRSRASNSSSSSTRSSTKYANPFDDEVTSHTVAKSKPEEEDDGIIDFNPFADDESPIKISKHVANGNKISSGHSSQSSSREEHNPFDDAEEVTSKPKNRGDSILDEGSLFDDEEMPVKPARERKSSSRAFAAKIKESGSRIKESASSSLSNVKLPSMPSSSSSNDKSEQKKVKTKQNTKDLFGEVEPGYVSSQNYFSQADQGRFANQSVEQLEQYAITKSQDTTSSLKNAIRIAEDTKGVATKTLETLHEQGDQIRRTHETAVHVDDELGRGEKLLGSLGGLFTRTWKPKKAHKINGPQVDPDHYKKRNHLGDRADLGLNGSDAARSKPNLSGLSGAQAQLEMERHTQDEAMSDLSNVLGQLKGMTLDMGVEIERQNGDLDRMHDDVHELSNRVKGANNRARHLLSR